MIIDVLTSIATAANLGVLTIGSCTVLAFADQG
jgi:hypothetical protein